MIAGIFMASSSLHSSVAPIIESHFIKDQPIVFAYVNFGSGILCIILFVCLILNDRQAPTKHKNECV